MSTTFVLTKGDIIAALTKLNESIIALIELSEKSDLSQDIKDNLMEMASNQDILGIINFYTQYSNIIFFLHEKDDQKSIYIYIYIYI